MGQAPIKIKTGNPLDVGDTTSNVATNKAELAALAANIDGKDSYPQSVSTQRLSVAQAMAVDGDSITLSDGVIHAQHLVQTESVITQTLQVGNNVITEDAINVPNLGAITANLGTISSGSISVGSGGVTVSGPAGGVYIGGNQIFLGTSESATVLLDGATGIITATKFVMTADGDSSMDMTLGSLTIGDATAVDDGGDGYTIADVATDSSAAYAAVSDLADDGTITPVEKLLAKQAWDTVVNEYSNLVTRATASGVSYAGLTTDYNALNTYLNTTLTVFSSMTTNTSVTRSTWDTYWKNYYDTASTLYASLAGDAELKADAAQSTASSAVQPGGGVVVDAQKYITHIDMSSGITVSTAGASSTGARTQITSNGMAIYNSSNQVIVQADHTNGVYINNPYSADEPGVSQRLSLAYGGSENSWIGCISDGTTEWVSMSYPIDIFAAGVSLYSSGVNLLLSVSSGYIDVAGGNIIMRSGLAVQGIHKSAAGNYKANGSFSFYAASSSGGSPTTQHTVTFTDGLITSWAAS